MSKESVPENQAFEGSATRSKQSGRYDLISPAGVHAMARRLKLGAERHGERNWESGGESFRQATVSHMMAHLLSYMEKPNSEDADALICNAMFLCHFEAKREVKSEIGDEHDLCLAKFGAGHTCVRKRGHEEGHSNYGIGS